ncbi:glycosyltransferase [Sulfitobacter sp. JBTF-M27]|uniref:Chitooligosaccharide deacetylase n=1 Tax=Sulfitobacter sediminilitoris TaxID=2698830 RepID=A0A6P0CJV3_9RHOB|nr:glycosyltransferase [Sulfitobacter sediminilitoris]NEK24714.1 glycosyltransferase [Sulfitobacter sediminilitoris]
MKRFAFHYELLETGSAEPIVFSDPLQGRRKRLRRRFVLVVTSLLLWTFFFFVGAQTTGSDPARTMGASATALPTQKGPALAAFAQGLPEVQRSASGTCEAEAPPFAAMAAGASFSRVFAHLPVALDWAHLSLDKSCETIDVLVPDWITVTELANGFAIDLVSEDTRMPVDDYVAAAITPPELMPRIQVELWPVQSDFGTKIARDQTRRALVSDLNRALKAVGAAGACLDLDQLPRAARGEVQPLLDDVRQSLEEAGLRSCLIVSGNDATWVERDLTDGFDHVIVKLFYEPWVGSAPRPLSENTWFLERAQEAMAAIGYERLVLAIGTFGASWESGAPLPRRLSYGEALSAVTGAKAQLTFTEEVSGSFAAFRNAEGRRQKVWLQDVASAFNQLSILEQIGLANVGIWSLGQEDPGLWPLLKGQLTSARLDDPALSGVMIDTYVQYIGEGPALRVLDRAKFGFRTFEVDPVTGLVKNQLYEAYPEPYRLERYGAPAPGELVLTFDDGPHPEFTPRILDILEETGTPAAFFVLGQNVMNHPDILQRVVEAGHEVGTHSFSHPRMDQISALRTHFEHTLTDRAVAGTMGRTTRLYREPFLRSGGPISADRIEPLLTVQSRGQINYGMDVVPKDWLGLTSDEIATYVIREVEAGAGNVILLHDGGGSDRKASVEALPIIISELRGRGYSFKSIGDVMGFDEAALMPTVTGVQPIFDRISFAFASSTFNGLVLVFWVVLLIGLCRSAVILALAALRRRHRAVVGGPNPKVAVIIPAFNEEAAIGKCIESVLASDYPWLEVVVVDDGSSDKTLNEILEFKHKTNVRMISHPNQGKWSALNRAILTLDVDVAVCIDADTQVAPDAVSKLVTHFQNPRVGAVAGKIVVGNPINTLTRMQALEYVTAQNFERRAFDHINAILVVPGAIGAWRVAALHKAGLFCPETLTEDCDLTISVNRAGYRIVYDERAVAYTEVPQTIRALMTQRLRWSLGMFQSAWKHKKAILEARSVGLASIPDMLIFGYLFPLLAPIADLFVLILAYHLIAGSWSGEVGEAAPLVSSEMLWAYLALPALEFLIATFAVLTERTAKKSLILMWPFQRIFYRPLLYLTVFRALLRALSGRLAVWGKSKRHGSDLLHREKTA